MRLLIMSVPCIFPPFYQKRREAKLDRKWRNNRTDGKSGDELQEGKWWRKERGGGWDGKGTISMS